MSYEIVRGITYRKKDNKIFITSASNNVYPKTFTRKEIFKNYDDKDLYLLHSLIGGSLQFTKKVSTDWRYALNKLSEFCKEQNTSFSELWNLVYTNNGNLELLRPYSDKFKEYKDEKIDGLYYLDSNVGQIGKVYNYGFSSGNYINIESICGNYKEIYNKFYDVDKDTREYYEIKIKRFDKENLLYKEEKKDDELVL